MAGAPERHQAEAEHRGEDAEREVGRLRTVYETVAESDRLEHDVFDGEHRWNGERAYPFLARWLGDPRSIPAQ